MHLTAAPSLTVNFGKYVALAPDATYLAVSSSNLTKVFVYKLKGESGPITVEGPITVLPPLGFSLTTLTFGSALKITSKGRRLVSPRPSAGRAGPSIANPPQT